MTALHMSIWAMGGRAAMSLYGEGNDSFSRMKAMLPFCSAVSSEMATICGRGRRVAHANRAPNEKPATATHMPARHIFHVSRMKMCDKL